MNIIATTNAIDTNHNVIHHIIETTYAEFDVEVTCANGEKDILTFSINTEAPTSVKTDGSVRRSNRIMWEDFSGVVDMGATAEEFTTSLNAILTAGTNHTKTEYNDIAAAARQGVRMKRLGLA